MTAGQLKAIAANCSAVTNSPIFRQLSPGVD
jgi:hypothetical protein